MESLLKARDKAIPVLAPEKKAEFKTKSDAYAYKIKQACEEANKQAPGLNLNPQDWINNLSSETSLESILSTIETNAMMYNYMNNSNSTTTAEDPAPTT